MWQATGRARRPLASTSAATAAQASSLRLVTTTSAPASAKASTMARPRPRLPPVTRATLPASGRGVVAGESVMAPTLSSHRLLHRTDSFIAPTPSSHQLRHELRDGLAHRDVQRLVGTVRVGV